MDPESKKLTLKIHHSTFNEIEESGGTGLLFGEGGIFQRADNDEDGEFLRFEMTRDKRVEALRLIKSLPVSIRGDISRRAGVLIRNGVRGDGEQYTLKQELRGFPGRELPSCLALVYQHLKKGSEGSPDFWGQGDLGNELRREFVLLQEDLELDTNNVGDVAKEHRGLGAQLANNDDLADGWVFELDPNAIGVTASPCREGGKPKEEFDPLAARKTHARDPLGRSSFLVVSPVGAGNSGEPDNQHKIRMLIGTALLRSLRDMGTEGDPKDQEYLLQTGSALDLYDAEESQKLKERNSKKRYDLYAKEDEMRSSYISSLKAYIAGDSDKDISSDEGSVDHFFNFLSWAETHSSSPIFICKGFGSRNSFYGLPEGFVSHLVKIAETEGSGFASHVFDTSHDPENPPTASEPSAIERVSGVERVISSRSSRDWSDLGKIRQKLFEELNAGSPDFLSLAMGSGTAGVGDATDEGTKWKALKGALGPEFEECGEEPVRELVESLRKFQEEWGGSPPKSGSLVDFTNFLLNRVGMGLPEHLRENLKDALDQVKSDGKKTTGSQFSLYEKMENRERLCEVVGNAVFLLLGRGEGGKLSDAEIERDRKILRGLISNADKTENVYTMWRFGTPDIKFGKAKDVPGRGETLTQEGTPMLPLCSWSEVNIPVGDWNTSLLLNVLNLEENNIGMSFKDLTGVFPSSADGKTPTERRETRDKRLGELLRIFGVDKNSGIEEESFVDLLVSGLESRLGKAREAGDDVLANYKTIDALGSAAISVSDLEKKLCRLLEEDYDTFSARGGSERPDTSPLVPLLAGLLKARTRMYQDVDGGDKTTTPEEVRDFTSSLLVASVLICGGIKNEDLVSAGGDGINISKWSQKIAGEAKNFGGALGQTKQCRAAVYKYRRQYGALNTEKLVLNAVRVFRIGDESDMKTEVCGGVGYYLKAALAKIEAGLPEYVRASRRDYSSDIGVGGVQEAIRKYAHGNIYLSRPQTLRQEEFIQFRKRKTEETQILSGDGTKKKSKPKESKILEGDKTSERKEPRVEQQASVSAGFAVGGNLTASRSKSREGRI